MGVIPRGGGSGAQVGQQWASLLSDDLSSLANWTVVGGTWNIVGGVLRHTVDTGLYDPIYNNTEAYALGWSLQCEVNFALGSNYAGMACRWNGAAVAGSQLIMCGMTAANFARVSRQNSFDASKAFVVNLGQWYKMHCTVIGNRGLMYVDDVLQVAADLQVPSDIQCNRIGLIANGAGTIDFRNFKAWVLRTPDALT